MTASGDPLTSLSAALGRFEAMREAMQIASDDLTREETESDQAVTTGEKVTTDGTFPIGS